RSRLGPPPSDADGWRCFDRRARERKVIRWSGTHSWKRRSQDRPLRRRASARPLGWRLAVGAMLVMLLWAVCFPLIAVGLQSAPPMAQAAMRAALAGVVLLAAARAFSRPRLTGVAAWRGVVVIGLSATSVGFFGMFYGGVDVLPGIATVIANTQPLTAAVLAAILLGERLSRGQRLALLVGFAGIVLIGAPDATASSSQAVGMLYVLLGAAGVALGNIALKRLGGCVDTFWAMGWQL